MLALLFQFSLAHPVIFIQMAIFQYLPKRIDLLFSISSEVKGPIAEVEFNLLEFEIVSAVENVINATEEYSRFSALDSVLQLIHF